MTDEKRKGLGKCPDCGAGFQAKPHNRLGWFYAECGRRYNRALAVWEPMAPTSCLIRQRDQARAEIERWRCASMLNDSSGDPDTITPEHLERARNADAVEIERLRDEMRVLRAAAAEEKS